MSFQGDPHRTLGIPPGATLNEIRSAYRRLAKQYHPDAAGERALPRFLAIQAAYEQLVDGEGRLRPAVPATPAAGRTPRPTGGARASRDAWRARRGAGAGSSGRAGGSGASGTGASGTGAGGATSRRAPGSAGPRPASGGRPSGPTAAGGDGAGAGRPSGDGHPGRRGTRKATPGSTTYDEAVETPLDPAWDGGSWYGAASGTYWTLNPREYADPRKHGPEYEARAWRALRGEVEAGEAEGVPGAADHGEADAVAGPEPGRPAHGGT